MILSYFASRRRQRQAAIPALAHITPSPWRQGWRQLRCSAAHKTRSFDT